MPIKKTYFAGKIRFGNKDVNVTPRVNTVPVLNLMCPALCIKDNNTHSVGMVVCDSWHCFIYWSNFRFILSNTKISLGDIKSGANKFFKKFCIFSIYCAVNTFLFAKTCTHSFFISEITLMNFASNSLSVVDKSENGIISPEFILTGSVVSVNFATSNLLTAFSQSSSVFSVPFASFIVRVL